MRALLFDGKTARLDAHYADPSPDKGEVVIRPTRLGVSDMDLQIARGGTPFTGVLGHEFVGVVEAAGDAKGKKWVGKRVVGAADCVCGKCDMCKAGLKEHCRQRTELGVAGRNGCFADRFCLPAMNLLEVPDNVDDDRAVFAQPLAAACQIPRQLTIEGRPYITVLGDGRLGLLCAQVMSQLNATVRLVGKHAEKIQRCEKWRVKHRLLDDVGLRQDQDIVVDCTGSPSGLVTAMGMVRPRGTIVLKTTSFSAFPHAPKPPEKAGTAVDLSPLVTHEINLIGSRGGPLAEAMAMLSAERVDVISLITRRAKLAQAVTALRSADQPDAIKVLLEP